MITLNSSSNNTTNSGGNSSSPTSIFDLFVVKKMMGMRTLTSISDGMAVILLFSMALLCTYLFMKFIMILVACTNRRKRYLAKMVGYRHLSSPCSGNIKLIDGHLDYDAQEDVYSLIFCMENELYEKKNVAAANTRAAKKIGIDLEYGSNVLFAPQTEAIHVF